jgi:DNA-binding response OmpR family regulator
MLEFPPFRLDLRDGRLWRGKRQVELRPKTWELLRLLAERPGRLLCKDEARALLAPVYDGFTEGLDTLDLRDAKTLLDSL